MKNQKIDLFELFIKIFRDKASKEEIEDAKNKISNTINHLEDTYGEKIKNIFLNEVTRLKAAAVTDLIGYGNKYDKYEYIMRQVYKKLFVIFLDIIKDASKRNEAMMDRHSYKLSLKNNTKSLILYNDEVISLEFIDVIYSEWVMNFIKDLPDNNTDDIFSTEIKSIMFNCEYLIPEKILFKLMYKIDMKPDLRIDHIESERFFNEKVICADENTIDDIIKDGLIFFSNLMLTKINDHNDLKNTYINFMNLLSKEEGMKENIYFYKNRIEEVFRLIMQKNNNIPQS